MIENRPCGETPCDGIQCALVSLLLNQASDSLRDNPPGRDPRAQLTKEKFFAFLSRVEQRLADCRQPETAKETLEEVRNRANLFFQNR